MSVLSPVPVALWGVSALRPCGRQLESMSRYWCLGCQPSPTGLCCLTHPHFHLPGSGQQSGNLFAQTHNRMNWSQLPAPAAPGADPAAEKSSFVCCSHISQRAVCTCPGAGWARPPSVCILFHVFLVACACLSFHTNFGIRLANYHMQM